METACEVFDAPRDLSRHLPEPRCVETEDPMPLCYCFGYDRKAVRDDIRRIGDTDIQRTITERVKAGECRCEETNPSGACCLASVARAIKHAQALREQGRL